MRAWNQSLNSSRRRAKVTSPLRKPIRAASSAALVRGTMAPARRARLCLLITAAEKMQALDWLPALRDGIWNTSALLDDMTRGGGLVAALTGYRAQPSLTTVLVLAGYWAAIAWLLRRRCGAAAGSVR